MGQEAMCYVTHVQEPSALFEKRRGSPRYSWSFQQQIAPHHLYMVLSKFGLIIQTKSHIWQAILYVIAPGASLGDAHVRYIKSHNYYYHYYYYLFYLYYFDSYIIPTQILSCTKICLRIMVRNE